MNSNDSTQVTMSQVYQDFKGALQGAADALKTGAEHVYEILVRQQVVNSITYLIVITILSATTFFVLKWAFKNMFEKDKYGDQEFQDKTIPAFVIGGCLLIATIIVTVINVGTIVTGFVNPEYGAIMEIRSFIH